jgi:hypothetical protein
MIQYVDDTLVVLKADARELICLKALLQTFSASTGLKVNYSKSCMMPINMDGVRLQHFASSINCKPGTLPFAYLGLPLGISKPSLEHFLPIVKRVERRLCGIADFLDYGGKLLMVKYVLSSLPISFMACLDVPVTIKDQIEKYMRYFLWRKKNYEVQAKGSALIAWTKICKPKDQDGLGVLQLDAQNKALMLKNLHKFFNRQDIPWVNLIWNSYYHEGSLPAKQNDGSFWWKSHLKLLDTFKGIGRCQIGDGKTALLWTDLWSDDCLLIKFPHLASFPKRKDIFVYDTVNT